MKTIFFDLDGTLLPQDLDVYIKDYFGYLVKFMTPYGFDPKRLPVSVWKGVNAMVVNDGSCTNQERFWQVFEQEEGPVTPEIRDAFNRFYATDYNKAQEVTWKAPQAAVLIDRLKERGHRLIMATNPLYPQIASAERTQWAGLAPNDFELITSYENCTYCKPNIRYYTEICENIGEDPKNCIMIGNHTGEDLIAREIGMDVFILTDCLIDEDHVDLTDVPHGSFDELFRWLGLTD